MKPDDLAVLLLLGGVVLAVAIGGFGEWLAERRAAREVEEPRAARRCGQPTRAGGACACCSAHWSQEDRAAVPALEADRLAGTAAQPLDLGILKCFVCGPRPRHEIRPENRCDEHSAANEQRRQKPAIEESPLMRAAGRACAMLSDYAQNADREADKAESRLNDDRTDRLDATEARTTRRVFREAAESMRSVLDVLRGERDEQRCAGWEDHFVSGAQRSAGPPRKQ